MDNGTPVPPYCQDGSRQAQSNLTFLSILREPYQELAFMKPRDIADKLPKLISLIRIIWVNSPHYNTRERLTSLFRKVCGCEAQGWGGVSVLAGLRFPGRHVPQTDTESLELGLASSPSRTRGFERR